MNWLLFIAGLFGAWTTIGHFLVGGKMYLKPVLDSTIDTIPKRVIQSVFHYVSVYLILSSIALILAGVGVELLDGVTLLVKFIAVNYVAFAIWELVLALTLDVEKAVFKMFHWVFFVIIAVLAWIGA